MTNCTFNGYSRRGFLTTIAQAVVGLTALSSVRAHADEELFVSSEFTPQGGFTSGVEGPACDIYGNLYAVNFDHQGTIGKVTPEGEAEVFVELPDGSIGNGIRFDSHDNMFIADYTQHNVLKVDMSTREISVLAHEPTMHQPNDLAIRSDDTIFASDPYWRGPEGNIWRITPEGTVTKLDTIPGSTNGLEVSPDETILYVNTSNIRTVWAFDLHEDSCIDNKREIISFEGGGTDGMRCDEEGNLYVTRTSARQVIKVSPDGEILQEISMTGSPSNIAFGGPDGRTCYTAMADRGNIETFRVDIPGRSWRMYEARRPLFVQRDEEKPRPFELGGGFPNPFNASTTIEYTLHHACGVELTVLNTVGQVVAVLRREYQQAGRHSAVWNAGSAPSGLYFVRLHAGGASETSKVTLLR